MPYRVLIVEDETVIRNGLAALIPWEKYGFSIAALAENGYRALEMMENRRFDLVITDVRMPRTDGLEMLRSMREKNITSEVIILSGYANFDYARKAMEYGVRNYLLKPVDTGELIGCLQAVRSELDRREAVPPEEPSAEQQGPGGELCRRVTDYVAVHYGEELSIRMIADALHYNEVYLGRQFQKEIGLTFRDYLNTVRAAKAAKLLAAGGLVSNTAQKVGYKDLNYFCRVFKNAYGVTPSAYRKSFENR